MLAGDENSVVLPDCKVYEPDDHVLSSKGLRYLRRIFVGACNVNETIKIIVM